MPLIDLIDETFIVCDPAALAGRFHDEDRWRLWWPDLELSVFMDRGDKGIRWSVRGALVGSCEVWLEPFADGVIVRYYLRADLPRQEHVPRQHRLAESLRRQRAQRWKSHVNALKDELEGGRAPGRSRLVAALG